jgi:2-beta-glucuronyltransferase
MNPHKITFITGHEYNSPRKTGFYFWADILRDDGIRINWITVGQSCLSVFKKSFKKNRQAEPYNEWVNVKDSIKSFVWRPLFHPVNLGLLNIPLRAFFSLYPKQMPKRLKNELKGSDVVILESGAGLMMVPDIRKLCPNAKIIYYASDRMDTLQAHPAIVRAEKQAMPDLDLIRVASTDRIMDFKDHPQVRYIPQGIDKNAFNKEYSNPYTAPKNIICAGDMLFDADAVKIMGELFPDVQFHLFGKNAVMKSPLPNVLEYDEYAFEKMIPYLKYADIGIAPYKSEKNANYFAQSGLKIGQYTYCRMPVVLPDTITNTPKHLLSYKHNDKASIRTAIEAAFSYNRDEIDKSVIPGWNDVINQILVEAGVMKT